MSTPEQNEATWESRGEHGHQLMMVFLAEIDLAIARGKRDGLAGWAIHQGLTKRAEQLIPPHPNRRDIGEKI